MSIRIFHFSRTPVKEEPKQREEPMLIPEEIVTTPDFDDVQSIDTVTIDSLPFEIKQEIVTSDEETANRVPLSEPAVGRKRKYGPRQKRPKILKCNWCKKRFTHKGHYDVHLRIHTGEKPFTCEFCGRNFRHSNIWRMHRLLHTGEKPFRCGICHMRFSRRSYLKYHGLMHLGYRPFECNQCDEKFFRFAELRQHSHCHKTVKKMPYICEFCGRRFGKNSLLDRHIRVHTGERPYACGVCNKRFIQKSHLNNHLDSHRLCNAEDELQ